MARGGGVEEGVQELSWLTPPQGPQGPPEVRWVSQRTSNQHPKGIVPGDVKVEDVVSAQAWEIKAGTSAS